MAEWIKGLALLIVLSLLSGMALAEDEVVAATVADAYLDMHTGPGAGYPVFHVVDRGQQVELLVRRNDWFRVRAQAAGQRRELIGWVPRAQLERTLSGAGVATRFRDVLLDDYLASRLLVALEGGRFSDDPQVALSIGWRFNPAYTLEGRYARASGSFSRSELLQLSLVSHPFSDWDWQPTWRLGIGQLDNRPQATLVGAARVDSPVMTVGVGIERYLAQRFLFRAGYEEYVVLVGDNRSDSYRGLTAGFAVFF